MRHMGSMQQAATRRRSAPRRGSSWVRGERTAWHFFRAAAVTLVAAGVLMLAAAVEVRAAAERVLGPLAKPLREAAPVGTRPAMTAADLEAQQRARLSSSAVMGASIDPDSYTLGPYDLLSIMIVVGETRSMQLPVLPEGIVLVPNVGGVRAAGRTLSQFRTALQQALSQRYRDFELYCYLAEPRLFRVYVSGEVVQPGMVGVRAYERLSDAVERAGGFTDLASRRDVELRDSIGVVGRRVDLAAFYARGDLDGNPHLAAGMLVVVPVRSRRIDILGEVNAPGTYEPRRGETLSHLLEIAGGLAPLADRSQVSLESADSSGAVTVRSCDLRRDSPTTDDVVRVSVPSSLLGKRRVFVDMPDGAQRILFLGPGETLRDLLRRTAYLGPDADLAAAELATRDEGGRPKWVPADLEGVLRGDKDLALQDGDRLSIPKVRGYVFVSGHVTKPGRYPFRADWTVNDYVGEAGGPTTSGARDRVTLIGTRGTSRGGARETKVQQGETIYIDRSFVGKAGGFLGLFANISALIISIVALRR